MLQTCGISSKVTKLKNKTKSYLPNGKGSKQYYDTKPLWRLLVSSTQLQKLIELGFSPKRLKITEHTPQRNAEHFIKITNIDKKIRIGGLVKENSVNKDGKIVNFIIAKFIMMVIRQYQIATWLL